MPVFVFKDENLPVISNNPLSLSRVSLWPTFPDLPAIFENCMIILKNGKCQISLRIRIFQSESLVFTYTISGHSRKYTVTTKGPDQNTPICKLVLAFIVPVWHPVPCFVLSNIIQIPSFMPCYKPVQLRTSCTVFVVVFLRNKSCRPNTAETSCIITKHLKDFNTRNIKNMIWFWFAVGLRQNM